MYKISSFLLAILLFSGCVPKKNYDKVVNDLFNIQSEYSKLQQTVKDYENKIAEYENKINELTLSNEALAGTVSEKTEKEYEEVSYDMIADLQEELEKGKIEIERLKNKLKLTVAEELFFDVGSAEIKESAKKILLDISKNLNKYQDKIIIVEGHTDNQKIWGKNLSKIYPSNWELSAARAVNVVRFFIEKGKISPERLSAHAYGEYKPKASNKTPEGRQKNRRIEIILADKEFTNIPKVKEKIN